MTHDDWLAARIELLTAEKEFNKLRDKLSQRRRELPWERVEKAYTFDGAKGRQTLAQLFEGRSQLIVYHAMFDPAHATPNTSWTTDAACQVCSFWIDNFVNTIVHLNHRDVTLVAASRAPYPKIAAYMKRMGWAFNWVSSGDSDFNFDYGVSFQPIDIERGNDVYYNYRSEPTTARSFTRTRPMHAASTWSTPPTTTWIWFRRAGTRPREGRLGFVATMNTERSSQLLPVGAPRNSALVPPSDPEIAKNPPTEMGVLRRKRAHDDRAPGDA